MKDTKTKTMKTKTNVLVQPNEQSRACSSYAVAQKRRTKSSEAVVAEPEVVYGWGGVTEGYFMQYVVPKKDVSFFRDLAKVRGWKLYDKKGAGMYRHSELSERTKKAMRDALKGRVYHADSAEDMCEQILGKDWKEKDKTKTVTGKKVGRKKV